MVAFSLYRGNLHKVPDAPRRWRRPERRISLKDFKILLRRRAKALTRLHSLTTISNPSVFATAGGNSDRPPAEAAIKNDDVGNRVDEPCSHPEVHSNGDDGGAGDEGKAKDPKFVGREDFARKLVEKFDALVDERNEENAIKGGEPESSGNAVVQTSCTEDAVSDVEKKKKEIQEKLEILKAKKHGLVQVLKQILNAEEQLKSQNNGQGTPGRLLPSSQVDASADCSSLMKLSTPRLGSDGNTCGDSELPQVYRTTTGVAVSPSQITAPIRVPLSVSVSVSGAGHVMSSPSPAAASSGGTSVFREGRLTNPWN